MHAILRFRPALSAAVAALTLGLVSTAAAQTRQNTIHVPGNHATIQTAIDAAQNGDTIIVAPGTYHEAIDFLGKTITLESEAGAEKTIIDATGLDTSVVTLTSGEGEGTTLRGFTITGGVGTLIGEERWGGGILLANAARLFIEQCVIIGNHVEHFGGGIAVRGQAVVHACKTAIESNTAGTGGGGAAIRDLSADPDVWNRFEQCTFLNNVAVETGGGLRLSPSGSAYIDTCHFESNTVTIPWHCGGTSVGVGGALCFLPLDGPGSRLHVVASTFESNSATWGGGAAIVRQIDENPEARPRFDNCVFRTNTANYGGAVTNGSTPVPAVFTDSVFEDNYTTPLPGCNMFGGALDSATGPFHLVNCTFRGNSSILGGACSMRGIVEHCLFEDNHAEFGGALMHPSILPLEVYDSSFIGNTALFRGGAIRMGTSQTSRVIIGCDFLNNTAGEMHGAISRDTGTYQLGDGFFCGNTPDHTSPYDDLGGNTFAPSADLNCDGVVDVLDLLILLDAWGECKNCDDCPADLNGDCSVDVLDLLFLLDNWG